VALVRSTVDYFSGSSSAENKRPTHEVRVLALQPNCSNLNIRLGGFSAAIALGLAAYGSYRAIDIDVLPTVCETLSL